MGELHRVDGREKKKRKERKPLSVGYSLRRISKKA